MYKLRFGRGKKTYCHSKSYNWCQESVISFWPEFGSGWDPRGLFESYILIQDPGRPHFNVLFRKWDNVLFLCVFGYTLGLGLLVSASNAEHRNGVDNKYEVSTVLLCEIDMISESSCLACFIFVGCCQDVGIILRNYRSRSSVVRDDEAIKLWQNRKKLEPRLKYAELQRPQKYRNSLFLARRVAVAVLVCLTLSLPRVINFEFPQQPHQKYYITQYEDLGFS